MLSAMKCEVYEIEEILDKCRTKETVVIQLFNLFIKKRTKEIKNILAKFLYDFSKHFANAKGSFLKFRQKKI